MAHATEAGHTVCWATLKTAEVGSMKLTESTVEDAALAWLESLGYAVLHGPEIEVGF